MSSILEEIETQIAGLKTSTTKSNVGVVRETGDGVARVEGLSDVMLNEMIEFAERRLRSRAQPRGNRSRRHSARRSTPRSRKATKSRPPADCSQVPVGKALARPRRQHARSADRRQGADQHRHFLSGRKNRARHHQTAQRQPAGADRHHGDRRDDPDRSRPARVDHRRPCDR